jgi:NADH-quinone oxidoreductase subunit F
MDLKHLEAEASADERAAIDRLLGSLAFGPDNRTEALSRRSLLLPALLSAQARVGYVSEGALAHICRRLGVPPAEAWGVASFYALLALAPRPAAFAHICDDIACSAKGAEKLCGAMKRAHGPAATQAHRAEPHVHGAEPHVHGAEPHALRAEPHAPRGKSASGWARSPCLGLCDQAPAAMVSVAGKVCIEQAFGAADMARVEAALGGTRVAPARYALEASSPRRLLARAGRVDPCSIEAYTASGGWRAWERALVIGREGVINELNGAKLVGRGGAAFPTGRKWDAVAKAPAGPRYLVCNADESEPGTFKDRVLLEEDPFALIEAMAIGGYATGAEQGYIYLRGEYPLAAERLEHAIAQSRAAGRLGPAHAGKPFAFDIELRRGAGAYICGEETALCASIEGFRGEPRTKPPFPVHQGLFGKPTAINNVETLVAVLDIVRDGAAAYAAVGTPGSPGTKLFCVSGTVRRPGVYEVPFGTKLGELIELAGGLSGSAPLQGILLGGAAGVFVGPDKLALPLSFEDARAAGATLGSGVVFVLDETIPLVPTLRRIAAFFRDESCGQCVPCRVGTVRQEELLARLANGKPRGDLAAERALLSELGQAMRDASICGLGQTASSAIESALAQLRPFGNSKQ